MTNFARVINNVAVDVSANPGEQFHPDIAGEFEEVPDDVQCGWRLIADEWESPPTSIDPIDSIVPTEVDPITFKLLFTSAERIAAKELRATDPVIDDFWSILDDPRTVSVNMKIPSVQAAIEHTLTECEVADVEARMEQILQGIIQ